MKSSENESYLNGKTLKRKLSIFPQESAYNDILATFFEIGERWQTAREQFNAERYRMHPDFVVENATMQISYEQLLSQLDSPVLVDGTVGSLSFGVASPKFGSDIDGIVFVASDPYGDVDRQLQSGLSEKGIPSSVRAIDKQMLQSISPEQRARILFRLFAGTHSKGDENSLIEIAKIGIPLESQWDYHFSNQRIIFGEENMRKVRQNYIQRIDFYNGLKEGKSFAELAKLYPEPAAKFDKRFLS